MKNKILLISAVFSANLVFGTGKEIQTQTTSHSVAVSSSTEIKIQGKHTYLEIETWDKDEVAIEATVTFNGKITDRVQKFLDEFEQNVRDGVLKTGNELKINTRLDEPNRVQIGSKHVGVIIGYSEKELRIEYIIKVPGSNDLTVKGAYKDIVMIGTYDDVEITQYSADLTADTFKKAKLNLKYGDAEIKSIGNLTMEVYEQDMEVNKIGTSDLNVKYSDLTFDQVDEMTVIGYETDFYFVDIESLDGNLKYGEMEIESKLSRGTLTLYEFNIDGQGVGNLRFENSKYSNIEFDRANEIKFIESYEDKLDVRYINTLIAKSKYGEYTIDQLGHKVELFGYEDDLVINDVADEATGIHLDGKYLNLDIDLTDSEYRLVSDLKYGKVDYDESKVDVRKYIKENSMLKIELASKRAGADAFLLDIRGYEVDVFLD